MNKTTGYEKEWDKIYGLENDPIRKYILYPEIEKILAAIPHKHILDAGCGNGNLFHLIRDCDFTEGIGLDISSEFIHSARNHIGDKRVKFIISDLTEHIKCEDSWADVVFSIFVMNEILEIQKVFEEIHRVLKPNGNLILIFTHPSQLLYELVGVNKEPKLSGDLNYFVENELIYHFTLSNARSRYYHHNFEHTFNALSKSKLILIKSKEIGVSDYVATQYPKYFDKRGLPLYLILQLEKA